MPTKELQDALRASSITNVETDFVDVLCKTFDAPRPLVLRLLYAVLYASTEFVSHRTWMNPDELPTKLREAIQDHIQKAWRRIRLREIVHNNGYALAFVDALIPKGNPAKICDGCPKSLECVAESLFRPEDCYAGKGAWSNKLETRPIKIDHDKVTVECDHPRGRFVLNVKDFDL